MKLRRELEHLEIPGEHDARTRTWDTLRAAFAEREPARRRLVHLRPLAAIVVAAALVAGILSPPGDALLDSVREAIGVETAQVALFSLPAQGRVLATSPDGAWVVSPDGSKRHLGPYREASWSPTGLFVVAARENELAALEPDGDVRWTLARRDVRFPRWGGTRVDTRIAYLSGNALRVVAGDGTGDRALADAVTAVAPAWHPSRRHVLAFVAGNGAVSVYEADGRRRLWRTGQIAAVKRIEWSPDGRRLAVVSRDLVALFAWGGRRAAVQRVPGIVDAAFAPDGRQALLLPGQLRIDRRTVSTGLGEFTGVVWSPDGRWLLLAWPEADQWLFLQGRRVEAAANVAQQFGGFARPEGWCCASP